MKSFFGFDNNVNILSLRSRSHSPPETNFISCFVGTAFNQLAVLVKDKNDNLDSIYYYQRRYKETRAISWIIIPGAEFQLVVMDFRIPIDSDNDHKVSLISGISYSDLWKWIKGLMDANSNGGRHVIGDMIRIIQSFNPSLVSCRCSVPLFLYSWTDTPFDEGHEFCVCVTVSAFCPRALIFPIWWGGGQTAVTFMPLGSTAFASKSISHTAAIRQMSPLVWPARNQILSPRTSHEKMFVGTFYMHAMLCAE